MKTKFGTLFMTLPALALVTHAFAAGAEGHGGAGIVCRDSYTNAIVGSVEVLDLKEAVKIYGLAVTPDPNASDKQIQRVIDRLSIVDSYLAEQFQETLWAAKRAMHFTAAGTALPLLNEYSMPIDNLGVGSNCQLEQLALYYDATIQGASDILDINRDLYSHLNDQNVATLLVHEVIYKLNRTVEVANRSVEAREMTAYLMADQFNLDRFKVIAKGKLPTPVSDRIAANPIQIQLISGAPVIVLNHCGFWSREYGKVDMNKREGICNGLGDARTVVPGSGTDMNDVLVEAVGGEYVEFYQNDQKLKSTDGKDRFNIKVDDQTYSFLLMPFNKK